MGSEMENVMSYSPGVAFTKQERRERKHPPVKRSVRILLRQIKKWETDGVVPALLPALKGLITDIENIDNSIP